MSSLVAGVGERARQLDQQRLEADPQLQRRLAVAAGVEVGAGAQQQRLAGVDPLAAAEHRGDPLLRPQLLVRAGGAARRRRPRTSTSRAAREAAGGDLLAAAVADPHRDRALGRQLAARAGRRRRPPGRGGRG